MDENKFSIDDVRRVLFAVDNQCLTVRELRGMLFEFNNTRENHTLSELQEIITKGE